MVTKMSGLTVPASFLLCAGIADRLSILCYQQTKDAQHGRNKPTMIVDGLLNRENQEEKDSVMAFSTPEAFEEAKRRILSSGGD